MISESIVFIHLSDIHFAKKSGSVYDYYDDIRNELNRSVESQINNIGIIDGILVSGDISYSGEKSEFNKAKDWLKDLTELVDLDNQDVWCVPGNHDVSRRVIDESYTIDLAHKMLRNIDVSEIDDELIKCFGDTIHADNMLSPIIEYNKFAAAYGCDIDSKNPVWQYTLEFTSGIKLIINGLNSTIVSSSYDLISKEIILGRFQVPKMQKNSINLVLCHHPPSWWKDKSNIESIMFQRSHINLFGHKHQNQLSQINNSIQLVSGAVHPERTENNWLPCYNIIELFTEITKEKKVLVVKVYPLKWDSQGGKFINEQSGEGEDHIKFELILDDDNFNFNQINYSPPKIKTNKKELTLNSKEELSVDDARLITYKFFLLPHINRIDIARKLELIEDTDEGIIDSDLYKKMISRAKTKGILKDLIKEIIQMSKSTT